MPPVPIKDIADNPFRAKSYELSANKLEALKESIDATGFWDNIVVRKNGTSYEAAYGHHRVVAAQRLGLKEIGVIVKKLSDDEMVRIMWRENDEVYGGPFDTTLEAVEMIIKRFAKGLLTLPAPPLDTSHGLIRYAPSFIAGRSGNLLDRPYTATSIGRYLGLLDKLGKIIKASQLDKIKAALRTLQAIEQGTIGKNQIVGMPIGPASVLTKQASDARKRAEAVARSDGKAPEVVEQIGRTAANTVAGVMGDAFDEEDSTIAKMKAAGRAHDPSLPKKPPPIVEWRISKIRLGLGKILARGEKEAKEIGDMIANRDNIEPSHIDGLAKELKELADRALELARQLISKSLPLPRKRA